MPLPIQDWLLYILTVTAFVGAVSGVVLAVLWAIRCALGLDPAGSDDSTCVRQALHGFRLILGGIAAGAVVVVAAGIAPFLLIVLAVRALFGDYPPALAATATLVAVMGLALLVAIWFATWWRRLVWTHFAEVAA